MTGDKLVKAMERNGWDVQRLSTRLDVSYDTIVSWRIDRRGPCCVYMLDELERALKEQAPTRRRA